MNNNKFLAISTCINKDLFIILPITNIYIYIYKHKIKIKEIKLSTAITKVQAQPSQEDAKMAVQVLLIRPTHKKHKTNPITPITTPPPPPKKEKKKPWSPKHPAITQYKQEQS